MTNKLEYLKEFWRDRYNYLHQHPCQGKIWFFFSSFGFCVSMIIFSNTLATLIMNKYL